MAGKMRWGDSLDDDDDSLPPTQVIGPDKNGTKTVVEYYKNDKGESVKKTTKIKVVKVEKKIYKVGSPPSSPPPLPLPPPVLPRPAHPSCGHTRMRTLRRSGSALSAPPSPPLSPENPFPSPLVA